MHNTASAECQEGAWTSPAHTPQPDLSKQFFIGAAGYLYDQVSGDSGSGDHVGSFESRVVGIGPQIGYIFPLGNMQGYLNLKGYGEFDAHDRPSDYNLWLTFAISPAAPTPPTPKSDHVP